MNNEKVFKMSFASVYPHYINKAERKGRTKQEVDQIICWLTGYTQKALQKQIDAKTSLQDFLRRRRNCTQTLAKLPALFAVTG